MLFGHPKLRIPTADEALPGRSQTMPVAPAHTVLGTSMTGPWAEGVAVAYFGLGCFWGAERCFWQLPGVVTTAVGYQGGHTPNATYREVCSGETGHNEVVRVVYDPVLVSYEALLKLSEPHRMVVVLHDVQGMSHDEIAEIAGLRLAFELRRGHDRVMRRRQREIEKEWFAGFRSYLVFYNGKLSEFTGSGSNPSIFFEAVQRHFFPI